MKVSEHFELREFVDQTTYLRYGDKCLNFIDVRLFTLLERIRELCGNRTIIVNDWHVGGKMQYRGFRPSDCNVGALKSMHKQGKAIDFNVKGLTAQAVRNVIRQNEAELSQLGLTRIEKSVGWVHIDLKITNEPHLVEFNP